MATSSRLTWPKSRVIHTGSSSRESGASAASAAEDVVGQQRHSSTRATHDSAGIARAAAQPGSTASGTMHSAANGG